MFNKAILLAIRTSKKELKFRLTFADLNGLLYCAPPNFGQIETLSGDISLFAVYQTAQGDTRIFVSTSGGSVGENIGGNYLLMDNPITKDGYALIYSESEKCYVAHSYEPFKGCVVGVPYEITISPVNL